jgi:hypothetical protein
MTYCVAGPSSAKKIKHNNEVDGDVASQLGRGGGNKQVDLHVVHRNLVLGAPFNDSGNWSMPREGDYA